MRQPDPRSGDLLIASISIRPATSTINTPSGWTLLDSRTGTDGGAEGADTGSVGHYVFYKVADGTEGTANQTFTENGTTSAWIGSIFQIRSATGTYDLSSSGYSIDGDTTNFGGTLDADIGLTAGDVVLLIASTNGDLAAHSAQNITATGISAKGTVREHGEFGSTTGNDIEQTLSTTHIWTGTNTATPTITHTASVASSGTMTAVRIRQGAGTNRTDTWVRSAGAQVAGSGSVAVPYPEHDVGDRLVLFIGNKYDTATPTTPANWTLISNDITGGAGSPGNDAGNMRISAYYRDVVSQLTGTQSVTVGSGNSTIGQMVAIHKDDVTSWVMDNDGGADNTSGTAWSVTGAGLDLSSTDGGDVVLVGSAINTDVRLYSGHSMTASGITFGDVTQTTEFRSTTGTDMTLELATGRVSTGTVSDAVMTFTSTANGSAASNPAGASLFLAIRGVTGVSINLSGTCQDFDQSTNCTDTGTLRVAVNGTLQAQTQPTVAGSWSISSVPVIDDAIVTVFIDGAADSDEAVAVFKWDNSGDINNIKLYKEHLTIGTDGGLNSGQTITIADLDDYDVTQDEDVFYDVMTAGTCNGISSFTGLCVDGSGTSSQERLTILPGNTFTPGGSVISANLEVLGTLSGTNDITITSGNATGSGTVNLTGGTFLVDGTGSFGSNSNWTFSHLSFGDGSGSSTTTATGSGDITVTGTLAIEANQTLSAGAKTYILSGTSQGGGFRNHGTFTAGTSTVRYTGLSTGLVDYKDLFQQYSTQYWGTAGWTSSSFTPTAGKRLFVVLGGIHEGSVDVASNLTLSDSQGLTWTSIGTVNENTPWTFGVRAFISSVVPSTTSTTVTADAGSLDMSYYIVSITEVAGSDGTVTGFVADNNMNSDGPESLTLSQSPAAGSLGVFMKFLDEGALTASPTMGAGWTLISHLADQNNLHPFSVAVRPNMSGTTVTIDDMSSGATGSAFKTLGMAFSIEPGSPVITPANYNNLELVPNTNGTTFTLGSGTFNVTGSLTIGNGTNTGVVINADTNNPILNIDGDLVIAANTTFTASSSSSFHLAGDFTNNGTFTNSSGSIIFDDSGQTSVISGNNTFNNFTVTTAGKNIQFTSGSTTTINGLLTVTGSNGSNVVFTSTTGSSSWTINHQGTENITYLTVSWGACHASSTAIDMTGTGNTNGGNNGTCWTFPVSGITISGVVYQSDGSTPDGTGYTLNISTNGGVGTTTTSNGSGVFSFADFTEPTAGDVVTIWLDGSAASLVLKYGSSCTGNPNCTGLSLVQGQVRLQSFNGASFTNSDLDDCDNNDGGFGCNSASIGFDSDGTHLTVATDRTLVIASGTTFAPGGSSNVSAGGLNIAGTYTASSGNLTIGGNFTNSGTFTAGSGTVVFNDVSRTSQIIGSTTFNTLISLSSDKQLEFESGETFTITNQLTLTGSNGHPIVLTGTSSSPWYIDLQGTASVARVTVSWGGCAVGSNTIRLGGNSTNAGNNDACWDFLIFGPGGGSSGGSGSAGSGGSGGGGGEAQAEPRTASATATIQDGVVNSVTVTDGGFGYSTAPLVCFEQGSPTADATGTSVLTNGSISAINITFGGTGYQSVPTIVIRPPGSPTGTCASGQGGGGAGAGGGGGSP